MGIRFVKVKMAAMFSRANQIFVPSCTQVRSMATLKEIAIRLKSVKNIQKITKSMKMVAAAKYARAERELKKARPYGEGAQAFFEKAEVQTDATKPNHLIVAFTSDRGLCGTVHSSVVRAIRAHINEMSPSVNLKIVCVGDKSRAMLNRQHGSKFLFTVNDVGKKPPSFGDASNIAAALTGSGYEYDFGLTYFNRFKSVVAFNTSTMPLFTLDSVSNAEKISLYDSLDEETLRCYNEFALTNLFFYALKENACSEQSSRMTSMDNATKNAGEMIDKLTLTYNRTRQAVITRELIEIISGAAAV